MAASKRVGYAVVGLGKLAERAILPAFRRCKKSKLVAVVSGDESKAKRLAKKFGASDYYTYDEYVLALNHPQVDAVFIATPNGTHAGFTIRAAQSRKHVLCEKPMANSVEECQQMIDACRANDVRLMIGYRKRFDPACLAFKKLVAAGKLGRLKLVHSAYGITLPPAKSGNLPWRLDRKLAGGGSLVDVGVYCLNSARWFVGRDPLETSGFTWSLNPAGFRDLEENSTFLLKFPEGLVMQGSSSYGLADSSFLKIHGERGWAAMDPAFAPWHARRLFGEIGGRWFEQNFKPVDEYILELDAFANCILRRRDPEPNGLDGLKDVAIIQAIYKSARENRPIPLNFA